MDEEKRLESKEIPFPSSCTNENVMTLEPYSEDDLPIIIIRDSISAQNTLYYCMTPDEARNIANVGNDVSESPAAVEAVYTTIPKSENQVEFVDLAYVKNIGVETIKQVENAQQAEIQLEGKRNRTEAENSQLVNIKKFLSENELNLYDAACWEKQDHRINYYYKLSNNMLIDHTFYDLIIKRKFNSLELVYVGEKSIFVSFRVGGIHGNIFKTYSLRPISRCTLRGLLEGCGESKYYGDVDKEEDEFDIDVDMNSQSDEVDFEDNVDMNSQSDRVDFEDPRNYTEKEAVEFVERGGVLNYISNLNQLANRNELITLNSKTIPTSLYFINALLEGKVPNMSKDEFKIDYYECCMNAVKVGGVIALELIKVAYLTKEQYTAIVYESLSQDGTDLHYVEQNMLVDRGGVALAAVKQNGLALQYVWRLSELSNKNEIVLEAVKQTRNAYRYVPENMREFVRNTLNLSEEDINLGLGLDSESGSNIEIPYSRGLLTDLTLEQALNALGRGEKFLQIYLDTPNQNDKNALVLEAVRVGKLQIDEIPGGLASYSNRNEIALVAVRWEPRELQDIGVDDVGNYEEVALEAVQNNGLVLQFISVETAEELKNYGDIALAAVKQEGLALQYVHIHLILDDMEIYMAAVENNPYAIRYVPPIMRDDVLVRLGRS